MSNGSSIAPGRPGKTPDWTPSDKSGVGTSLSFSSRVWFTLNNGSLTEIYYPRIDHACVKEMHFLVTCGDHFFSDEKKDAQHKTSYYKEGAPAYRIDTHCKRDYYSLRKEFISDPQRDTVLQMTDFIPLKEELSKYRLFAMLFPHLGNQGSDNTAWLGDYKGYPMLFARYNDYALALACSAPWLKRSAGFAGYSDGYNDIGKYHEMINEYERADNGNVALTGEIDLISSRGSFLLSLGFGKNISEAGNRALASLQDGFEKQKKIFAKEWGDWQSNLNALDNQESKKVNMYRISTGVLRTHEAKYLPGGLIASLSIPWGSIKGDQELGGYHLIWPRDLVESAGGLLAAGAKPDVLRVLYYLQSTQEPNGSWPQNMWVDGTPYWQGVQMDETAFPILLADLTRREEVHDDAGLTRLWPMVKRAAGFLVCNGPVTGQDRWEEDPGYSPFTLAVEISALLAAADIAELNNEHGIAEYLRQTADIWNANIENWTYVTDTDMARRYGLEGYYVRIAPPDIPDAASLDKGYVPIKNRPLNESNEPARHIVSPDALALVRFGLRSPDDPRIINTVKIIDELLKVETPYGPAWHRYNYDGYGEHGDGSPFDGIGIGRAWPLFTSERAQYEIAAKRFDDAAALLESMEAFANESGLIPEQVWDTDDIPEQGLYLGRPTGGAMPLVWAHAEYIKLLRSLRDRQVYDMPPQTRERYQIKKTGTSITIWHFNQKCRSCSVGNTLRLEVLSPAMIRWSSDDWKTFKDTDTKDTGLGMHYADLPAGEAEQGTVIRFTFYWEEYDKWEGKNFEVIAGNDN